MLDCSCVGNASPLYPMFFKPEQNRGIRDAKLFGNLTSASLKNDVLLCEPNAVTKRLRFAPMITLAELPI